MKILSKLFSHFNALFNVLFNNAPDGSREHHSGLELMPAYIRINTRERSYRHRKDR